MTLFDGLNCSTAVRVETDRNLVTNGHDIRPRSFLLQPAADPADDRLAAIIRLDGKETALGFDDEAGFRGQVF